MDIKTIFKGLTENEATQIIQQCVLEIEEIPIALNLFVEKKPRSYICDEYGLSLGKYHYMLNRIIPKIQTHLKLKLFKQ